MSTSNPPITISSLDYERIETLLESDAAQNMPGIEALEAEQQALLAGHSRIA